MGGYSHPHSPFSRICATAILANHFLKIYATQPSRQAASSGSPRPPPSRQACFSRKKCITSNQTCKFLEKHMPQPSRLFSSGETHAPATQTKRMVDRAPLTSDLFAGVFLCKRRNQLRFSPHHPRPPMAKTPIRFALSFLGTRAARGARTHHNRSND